MRRGALIAAAVLGFGLVLQVTLGQEPIKSGPQVGQDVPGPFHPFNVTGESKGKRACLYCSNGPSPVAVVFAREATPAVAKLIKKLDEATLKNNEAGMGSYAVFHGDQEELQPRLEALAQKQGLKALILSIEQRGEPKSYNIAREAEVTVLLYNDFTVRANHAFAKGQLNDAAIESVVKDVSKIVK